MRLRRHERDPVARYGQGWSGSSTDSKSDWTSDKTSLLLNSQEHLVIFAFLQSLLMFFPPSKNGVSTASLSGESLSPRFVLVSTCSCSKLRSVQSKGTRYTGWNR